MITAEQLQILVICFITFGAFSSEFPESVTTGFIFAVLLIGFLLFFNWLWRYLGIVDEIH